jgi:hypothetical protein
MSPILKTQRVPMKTIEINGKVLPGTRAYGSEWAEGREREVACFADGKYQSRGEWSGVLPAVRNTWNYGSIGRLLAKGCDVRLMLDVHPSAIQGRTEDSTYLCWPESAPLLTVEEFKQWLKATEGAA